MRYLLLILTLALLGAGCMKNQSSLPESLAQKDAREEQNRVINDMVQKARNGKTNTNPTGFAFATSSPATHIYGTKLTDEKVCITDMYFPASDTGGGVYYGDPKEVACTSMQKLRTPEQVAKALLELNREVKLLEKAEK